jgi:hypothetical protein
MAWYLRKAFRLGPLLRLNVSKSGLGLSFGIKGLRIGVDGCGRRYLAGGRHGLYFRENLSTDSTVAASAPGDSVLTEPLRPSWALWLFLGFLGLLALAVAARFVVPAGSSRQAPVDGKSSLAVVATTEDAWAAFVREWGAPDSEQSNADVQPTPAVVTRILFYDRARLSVGFSPDAPIGASPPFARWVFNAAFDTGTNAPISLEEARRRLAGGAVPSLPPVVVEIPVPGGRSPLLSSPPSYSSPGGGSGRVYVHGYTRADGTYVAPHTRAAPGHGGGRHR